MDRSQLTAKICLPWGSLSVTHRSISSIKSDARYIVVEVSRLALFWQFSQCKNLTAKMYWRRLIEIGATPPLSSYVQPHTANEVYLAIICHKHRLRLSMWRPQNFFRLSRRGPAPKLKLSDTRGCI